VSRMVNCMPSMDVSSKALLKLPPLRMIPDSTVDVQSYVCVSENRSFHQNNITALTYPAVPDSLNH
jgi:hypothetical protein